MKTLPAIALGFAVLSAIFAGITALSYCGEAASVAREETGPRAMRDKYRWFKQQHERIDKAREDVRLHENAVFAISKKYHAYGDPADWAPHIATQFNAEMERAQVDMRAVTSHHDNMVRDYNAASADFLWEKFDAEGKLPREHHRFVPKERTGQ